MSRTYRRTSTHRRQEDRQLSVRAVRRNPPDATKLSRAFINLALAQARAEADATASNTDSAHNPAANSTTTDGADTSTIAVPPTDADADSGGADGAA